MYTSIIKNTDQQDTSYSTLSIEKSYIKFFTLIHILGRSLINGPPSSRCYGTPQANLKAAEQAEHLNSRFIHRLVDSTWERRACGEFKCFEHTGQSSFDKLREGQATFQSSRPQIEHERLLTTSIRGANAGGLAIVRWTILTHPDSR